MNLSDRTSSDDPFFRPVQARFTPTSSAATPSSSQRSRDSASTLHRGCEGRSGVRGVVQVAHVGRLREQARLVVTVEAYVRAEI